MGGIDPEKLLQYRATFICQCGLCCCIVWPSFLFDCMFRKNSLNFFGEMVYRPPLAKNFPYAYVLKQVSVERSSTVICLPSRTGINELEFRSVGFSGEGKPECQEKNLVEEGREPTTNSTHLWSRRRDLNRIWAGGGKFSHFLAPCHPKMNFFYSLLEASHYIIWLEAN